MSLLQTFMVMQWCPTGVEQQQQSGLAAAAQQSEARLREVEAELMSRLKAMSQLVDHTAKAGSQAMTHVAHLEAHTQADIAGMPHPIYHVLPRPAYNVPRLICHVPPLMYQGPHLKHLVTH